MAQASSIPARFFIKAAQMGEQPAYQVKIRGSWQATSWTKYATEVRRFARALMVLGLAPNERVSVLGTNRPEWMIAALGAQAAGCAPAGIYTSCSAVEVGYILRHSEARVLVLENAEQWEKVKPQLAELPQLIKVVTFKDSPKIEHERLVIGWDNFLLMGAPIEERRLDERIAQIKPESIATLIYTSGTTGPPKGAMLTQAGIGFTIDTLHQVYQLKGPQVGLSYLPLAHAAEQILTCYLGLVESAVGTVYFAESMEKLRDNIKEVRPTWFLGVPRVWEKFHSVLFAKTSQLSGTKKRIFDWASGVAAEVSRRRNLGQPIGSGLMLQYRLAERLVLRKIHAALGFDRCTLFSTGAAPIGKDVLEYFASLGIILRDNWGLSEATLAVTTNCEGRTRFGTVGRPLPETEIKIAEDQEIIVRGPQIFAGYFKDPAGTAEVIVDGWLHTGDLGTVDADGFLQITGRKKEILITAGGKNVAPVNIEEALKRDPLIAEAVVIGDRRPYLSLLVVIDETRVAGRSAEQLNAEVQRIIDRVNPDLARVEQIKKFRILSRPFSLQDGELTPTLKLKRKVIVEHFASTIETMYSDASI